LQTVSKRPNLDDLAFKKAKWQPWHIRHKTPQNFEGFLEMPPQY